MTPHFPNPNGIASNSPGLERSDYPGWPFISVPTPTGLRQMGRGRGHNPFRVGDVCFTLTRGSPCRATLGWRTESRWDSAARDLEQTIARNVTGFSKHETGRLCRLVAVRKDLAVHGLEGDIRYGGQVNSYYDDPHDACHPLPFASSWAIGQAL
jgi:hypothetical protein